MNSHLFLMGWAVGKTRDLSFVFTCESVNQMERGKGGNLPIFPVERVAGNTYAGQ